MTYDVRNPKHAERIKKLRKPIRNCSSDSAVDHLLYVEKDDKSPIQTSEFDFEKKFTFDDQQSRYIKKFIFSSDKNRKRYYNRKIKSKKKEVDTYFIKSEGYSAYSFMPTLL